jgi:hypothetical protein
MWQRAGSMFGAGSKQWFNQTASPSGVVYVKGAANFKWYHRGASSFAISTVTSNLWNTGYLTVDGIADDGCWFEMATNTGVPAGANAHHHFRWRAF